MDTCQLTKDTGLEAKILFHDLAVCFLMIPLGKVLNHFNYHSPRNIIPGSTQAFKNPDLFLYLDRIVLPELYSSNRQIQIWSAACSTGAEAYSLAMVALNFMQGHPEADIRVIATDIVPGRVEEALKGIFVYKPIRSKSIDGTGGIETLIYNEPHQSLVGTYSEERAEQHETRLAHQDVLGLCDFQVADMTSARLRADVIVVCNVMRYMGINTRRKARQNLVASLNHSGFVLVDDPTYPLFNLHRIETGGFLAYRKL